MNEPDNIAQRKMQFLFALRSKGVTDKRVLQAMEKIDRGPFVRGLFAERAYEDMPLPIACGQTISQPSVVGLMSQALDVTPRDKVLEVGTGSGYQAAILSQLARRVYTVDRHRRLVREASEIFRELDLTNRDDGGWQFRPARTGTVRPHPRYRRRRRPAGTALGPIENRGYHGGAGGTVGRGAEPDQGDAERGRVRL